MNHQHQMIDTCAQCGGTVELRSGVGRVASFRGREVPVPADAAIRTCVDCGAEWMNRTELRQYSAGMERQLRRMARDVPALQAPEAIPVCVQSNELQGLSGILAALRQSFDLPVQSVTGLTVSVMGGATVTNHAPPAPRAFRRVA